MKHVIVFAIGLVLILGVALFAEERTWTDRSGDFQVEATLLDFDGKQVKLKKKEDGKVLSLPLEKLSIPDQVYVKKMMESLGGSEESKPVEKAAEESPSKRKSKPKSEEEDDNETLQDNDSGIFKGKIPITRISTARQIRIDLTKPSWSVPADPVKVKNLDFSLQPLIFPHRKPEFSSSFRIEGICFADEVPEKVLMAASFTLRGDNKATKVFFGDMKSHLILSQTWPVRIRVLGLSPDGTKGLFLQETQEGRHDRKIHLTIADTTQPKLPCIGVLIPFAELKSERNYDSETEIDWANWIDNEHILVQSKSGRIAMLETQTGVAVWTLKASTGAVLSPGKKYLLTRCQDHGAVYVLLETQTGKPIGQLPLDKEGNIRGGIDRFAFSPDGTRIAGFAHNNVYLWNATNGSAGDSFYIGQNVIFTQKLFWIDNLYLMVDNVLVETKQQIPIWKYSGTKSEDTFFAGKYWHIETSSSSRDSEYSKFLSNKGLLTGSRAIGLTLFGINIPHETMPKLPTLTESQKYCIRPGVTIKLNVDSSIPDSEKVRDYVRASLRNNGINFSDQASISLNVELKTEEAKEIYYGEFLGRSITGHANFTPHTMSYTFIQDNKVLWKTSCQTAAPSSVSNEELKSRSLQDVVNEKGKLSSSWYLTIKFPKKIPFDKAGTSSILPFSEKRH